MPFMKYDCMDIVELFFASNLDAFNDSINEEFEMSDGESPAIDEVGGSEELKSDTSGRIFLRRERGST